jgi:acetyl esterase
MAEEPDPQVQQLLQFAGDIPIPPTYALSVESARDRLETFTADQPVEDVANTETYSIPGPATAPDEHSIPVRTYVPDATPPYPVLVYFHGGGWTVGGLDTHDNVCAALTNRANCLTVSVDYRLAPEHPFPAAVEDCFAAVEWVEAHADRINGDPDRIAIAGDSAGGNLAAAVTLMARDHGGPDLAYQGLIYPVVASPAIHDFESYEENAEGYFLETRSTHWYYDKYMQSPVHARNEYGIPLLADDLSGLPPATVITAGFDPLRDEGIEYAERLAADGVDVDHRHYEQMIHAFVSLPAMISQGEEALDALAEDLVDAF